MKTNHDHRNPSESHLDRFIGSKAIYLLFLLITLLIYGQTLGFFLGKLDDDLLIIRPMEFLKNLNNIGTAFMRDAYLNEHGTFYRPLQTVSYMIDAQFFMERGSVFYFTNMLLHATSGCALFYLLTLLFPDRKGAALFTLLFLTTPLFVHAVAWAPGRGDLMIGATALLTMIFFIKLMRTGKALYIPLAILTYGIALFSKETAILIPALLLLHYLFNFKKDPLPVRHWIPLPAGILSVTLFYFFMRMKVVNYAVPGSEFGWVPLINNLRVFPEFLAKFFIPSGYSPMAAFSGPVTLTGLLFLILLVFIAFRFPKRFDPTLLFGIAWFFIFTIPGVMYSHFLGSDAYDYLEHRAYLPIMGIVMFLHSMFSPSSLKDRKSYLPYAILALILVFSLYSFHYAKNYRDPGKFFDLAVATNPNSAVAWYNRGCFWADMGEHKKAEESYRKALAIREDYAQAWLNMGVSAYLSGDKEHAAVYYENATRFDSSLFQAWFNRATTADDLGKTDEALQLFEKAKKIYPGYAPIYTSVGLIFMKSNRDSLAMISFTQSLQLDQKEAIALINRGKLYYKSGMKTEACRDWQQAMATGNSDAIALFRKYCQ